MRNVRSGSIVVAALVVATLGLGVSAYGSSSVEFTLRNGDTNADGGIDVSDAVAVLHYLFGDGPPPAPVIPHEENFDGIRNGDSNGDGALDISDTVHLLGWLFLGGPEPVPFWASAPRSTAGGRAASEGDDDDDDDDGDDEDDDDVVERPVEDFVSQQGTFLPIPPPRNFINTNDPASGLCAVIDFAGILDATVGGVFETEFDGEILERPLPDGRAAVEVRLFTSDALTWVFADLDGVVDCDDGPIVFGRETAEAVATGDPGLSEVFLQIKFVNTAPGDPMPDFIQLLIAPAPGQVGPSLVRYISRGEGPLPDGSRGVTTNTQIVVDIDGDGLIDIPDGILTEVITVGPADDDDDDD